MERAHGSSHGRQIFEIRAAAQGLSILKCRRAAGKRSNRSRLRTQQEVKRNDVSDHEHGHVDDRYEVCNAELAGYCRDASPDRMVIIEDEIDHSHQIEGRDEQPKEWTYPYGKKRQDSEYAGRQVPVGGECGEADRQIRTCNAGQYKDQPEKAETVQGSNGALGFDLIHRPKPWEKVRAKAKQPRDITKNEMDVEDDFR